RSCSPIPHQGATLTRASALLAVALAALAIAAAALGGRAASPTLVGTVGPGFTIHLTQGGKAVKTLSAGSYTFVIRDKASIHNFTVEQESGGKFEKDLTSVPFTGTKTVKVTLKK